MYVLFQKKKNHTKEKYPTKSWSRISQRPTSIKNIYKMFFEYTKGQGGGLVRTVELKSAQRSAVVEFEKTSVGKYRFDEATYTNHGD